MMSMINNIAPGVAPGVQELLYAHDTLIISTDGATERK